MRIVEIDGSMGEGGGQILRTALAISAVTKTPVRIYNIRAKRDNPGLRPQHLTAVKAIARLCNARVEGDRVGSTVIEFYPGEVRGGDFDFDIGTAGSVSLVLQALLPVLLYAERPSRVRVRGGTDVPKAPTIDYMREVLSRLLKSLGADIAISVERRGHYPRGGGVVTLEVVAPAKLRSRSFLERGRLLGVYLRSHAVKLPAHVAERQAASASSIIEKALGVKPRVEVESYEPSRDPHLGPGSGVTAWALFEETVMGSDSLGAPGKRAEVVGEEAARALVEDIGTGAALDRHASDMIPLYLALAGGASVVRGAVLTMHAYTVLELLRLMLENYRYEVIEGGLGSPFTVRVESRGV
ncbi:MAG: RNA 3'-terminal phosphate cyclase [Acidilobaceae archaeon]